MNRGVPAAPDDIEAAKKLCWCWDHPQRVLRPLPVPEWDEPPF
ncbi:hypothetical protein [Streptomyces sp. ISL-98]|nr:hypothetical protein [Streptomyces sp. ISL-98]